MTRRPPLTRDLLSSLGFRLRVIETIGSRLPPDAPPEAVAAAARSLARELLADFDRPDGDTLRELQQAVMTVVEEELK
ncbi:hypothetical protein [Methylocystis sp. ATCC 49242]|uniref:hypothetical protein n=1 Tax=Methylocystis sp. ATCC 49242 TaxID=622637 RepID=UPI0001F86AB1|nr:hypothetical protein [Methylocystis sp. ATCC 49242]